MSRKDEPAADVSVAESASVFFAIEQHAKKMKVPAHIFAAVRQSKGWAEGKKVPRGEFEKAVKDFLGSPIKGGVV